MSSVTTTTEKRGVRGRRDLMNDSSSVSDEGSLYFLQGEERDFLNAKMFLMSKPDPFTPSLYEHLSGMIARLLEDGSEVTSDLEELSRLMKLERLTPPAQPMKDHVPQSASEKLAHAQWTMLKKPPLPVVESEQTQLEDGSPLPPEQTAAVPDILRLAAQLEAAGVGLPREEFVRMSLALRDLVNMYPNVQHLRFWGKVLGTTGSFYVAEGEFHEGDYEDDSSGTHEDAEEEESDLREEDSSLFEAGLPWIRLPHVTPVQIQVARKIRKYVTGDLDAQVVSNPPFPGTERNFLRAQIARITASTQVSPLGYYRFDDEGEEEEEHAEEAGGGRANIIEDLEFEGISVKDLADGGLQAWVHHSPGILPQDLVDDGLQAWVHHSPGILPQGRTTWWNPAQPKGEYNGEEEEDEDEEEERNEPDEPEPEVGPPLLTPLAEDEREELEAEFEQSIGDDDDDIVDDEGDGGDQFD
ncbi:RSH4A-like protein [Mya arenaria]|uniref:RSH4A-like protein n=1 Tax=Mya arenaria TaxID=6604 RepID=A0ABY7GBM4_MYAAR|nr:RSH4A-like protein [Mya arenaria]